jgi:CheY-like chemotaxis protein
VLPAIFDPYFTTKEGGTGLGLATAYAIVTKHNGHITVGSGVVAGTVFSLYLPASPHAIPPTQDVTETHVVGNGRILVMDDEDMIRDLLSEMLSSIGYEVDCAQDGAEAIALYERAKDAGQPYVAVILDITIPEGLGGRETFERLRVIDPQVKAIVSSGYANDPVMANAVQYGFSGVAPKPYTVKELSDVLHRAIRPKMSESVTDGNVVA